MKKIMVLFTALLLTVSLGCASGEKVLDAIITEVGDNYIMVEPLDSEEIDDIGESIEVPTDTVVNTKDSISDFEVGKEVRILYANIDGKEDPKIRLAFSILDLNELQ